MRFDVTACAGKEIVAITTSPRLESLDQIVNNLPVASFNFCTAFFPTIHVPCSIVSPRPSRTDETKRARENKNSSHILFYGGSPFTAAPHNARLCSQTPS